MADKLVSIVGLMGGMILVVVLVSVLVRRVYLTAKRKGWLKNSLKGDHDEDYASSADRLPASFHPAC